MTDLKLAHGLAFEDLYGDAGIRRIDALFQDALKGRDAALAGRLAAARQAPDGLAKLDESKLLLDLAPVVQDFVGELFGIQKEVAALKQEHLDLAVVFEAKTVFVQRMASKAYGAEEAAGFQHNALKDHLTDLFGGTFDQIHFARKVMEWMGDKEANADKLEVAKKYTCWAMHTEAGHKAHHGDVLFHKAPKTDYDALVAHGTKTVAGLEVFQQPDGVEYLHREGFHLTDNGCDTVGGLDMANYCVICHDRGRDNCRNGMRDKDTGKYAKNPLRVTLEGCPLEEKISEMHQAIKDGNLIGSLGIVITDNPMLAGTGHRICNDCMKACIYQKQEPVNIPQAETRMLKNVLGLPWGFEVYGLLTRWNPMNLRRPVAREKSGYKVLVVGAGPAGYTLSHYLLNEGHTVACIDGLKIEPLPVEISGVEQSGARKPFKPIRDVQGLWEPLDDRVQAGFGGVAEYGITIRWDKNFLKILRLLVERRARFAMYGGVRFGAAITKESAYEMGFDHVALCMGAGKPTFLDIPNNLARGVRTASDFLMALQLTGAAKKDSVANLQLRLPAVVIGGGLTAIDAATEALAFYVRQCEKYLSRYETLVAESSEEKVRAAYTDEENEIANEFIAHGKAIRAERQKAAAEGRDPDFIPMLQAWGGATIAYRRKMTGCPAYQLNHEEIIKAFEQGIFFAELLSPVAIDVDGRGHATAIQLRRQKLDEKGRPVDTDEVVSLPAKFIVIAAGTTPNTVLSREDKNFAPLDGKYFQAYTEAWEKVTPEWSAKPAEAQVLMNPRDDGRCMSFFGDLHQSYAGNVVKAMASARHGYPVVDRVMRKQPPVAVTPEDLLKAMDDGLRAEVVEVKRLTHNVAEITLKAPWAARAFKPGQFFRIQNYEANAAHVDGTVFGMEGVALTGAIIDEAKGHVTLISLDMGGSTTILQTLKAGERVILMGPLGVPTHMDKKDTALLLGGGLGNAVLMTINKGFHDIGAKVLYFAAYKETRDRFHIERIEENADVVVWCCDQAPGFKPGRPQDKAFVGNIVQAMVAYGKGELGPVEIPLDSCNHLIAIGSDLMMNAVKEARKGVLAPYLMKDHEAVASINSPMQCMMKEICGQCLQKHEDPVTGAEKVVYSCFEQDQPMDKVSFKSLRDRLGQNSVHEKLTRQWIARGIEKGGIHRV